VTLTVDTVGSDLTIIDDRVYIATPAGWLVVVGVDG
jgi:hypothetical protein